MQVFFFRESDVPIFISSMHRTLHDNAGVRMGYSNWAASQQQPRQTKPTAVRVITFLKVTPHNNM